MFILLTGVLYFFCIHQMLFFALRNLCNFDQMLFIAPLALYCIESIRSLFFGIAKVDIKIEMPSFEKFQMKRKTLQNLLLQRKYIATPKETRSY